MGTTLEIREKVSLKEYTTMKVGGMADFFAEISSVEQLAEAYNFASKENIPVYIIGGGSNVLISDDGLRGLVLHVAIRKKEIIDSGNVFILNVGAGEIWDDIVSFSIDNNAFGFENLSLIPGSVGASVVQNIGAYGVEVKDFVEGVTVFDSDKKDLVVFKKEDCLFGYRDSLFKREKKFVVTEVIYKLSKQSKPVIDYKDLKDYFSSQEDVPTPREIRNTVIKIRTNKLPDLKTFGTAGSFFKNPVLSKEKFLELQKTYPEIKGNESGEGIKVSAGWFIDNLCNMKGFCVGDACVYEKQALVIVNKGDATAKDIDGLAFKVVESVKEKTGIELEREVVSFV